MKFEQALRALEDIVEKLGNQDTELDDMLKLYEQGIHYMKLCQEKLAEAELKVEELSAKMNLEFPLEEENG